MKLKCVYHIILCVQFQSKIMVMWIYTLQDCDKILANIGAIPGFTKRNKQTRNGFTNLVTITITSTTQMNKTSKTYQDVAKKDQMRKYIMLK